MHAYRTHTCGALRASDAGRPARLSGWVHSKRDHGGLLFIDLRDHYGLTQLVFPGGSPAWETADALRVESCITVTGDVVARAAETVNPRLPTGDIEMVARELTVQSNADVLPMQVAGGEAFSDETRLSYRYLDLRRERVHANMMLRAHVIASLRRRMVEQGFHRVPDAHPDGQLAGGGARFPGAGAQPPRKILCAAAGSATIQAIADGGGFRPVFSDRAVFSR